MKKNKTHFPLFILLLLLLQTLVVLLVNSQPLSNGDASAMLAVKKSLNVPDTFGWTDQDICNWKYIRCDNGRVTKIQIKDQNLKGTLPPDLQNLTGLEDLELQGNQISGPLPNLREIIALQTLLLDGNNFSSFNPDMFNGLSSIQSVSMNSIPFKPWEIPDGLSQCSTLQNFSANRANVIGEIPGFFNGSAFPGLMNLHLSFNSLEGGLPVGFATLSVESLWLNGQGSSNKLTGTIDVLKNMTNLKEVWLHSNGFSGPIPDLSGLKSVSSLSLRDNKLTGPVPSSLMSLPSLKSVNLTNNLLQGPVPVFDKSVAVDCKPKTNSFCLDVPGSGCDPRVNALLGVSSSLGYPMRFAENWVGNDPCTPWQGITCINGNISVINFGKMNLSGTISPAFASLTSLEKLFLNDNNLFGPIPKELTTLPHIKEIDVSNNQLSGQVPSFANGVNVKVTGNPDIGKAVRFPPPPGAPGGGSGSLSPGANPGSGRKGGKVPAGVIAGSVIVVVILAVLLIGLGFYLYKRKKGFSRVQSPNAIVVHPRHSGSGPEMVKITVADSNTNVRAASEAYSHASSGPSDIQLVETGNMVISIQVLRDVTNNFSEENILGRGGFGTVYKGELHDGTKIAVKRMESGVMSGKGLTEFQSEIAVLTKVRHRHLVALIGYCLDGNERLLVYEYMPQGTLSHHLFNWKDAGLKPLEWSRRLIIALDVARGVEYLHGLAHQSFIHRDLKPSNILLGDDMRAKVADFGLVRLAPEGKASIETRLAGTFGYLAPEYAVTGRVTTKVDVYSFGVILMELITGRKALEERESEESMHLVSWFRRMHINKDTFRKAIDPTIDLAEETYAAIMTVAELAGHCTTREPYQRPDMGHVVNVLSSLVELWKPTEKDSEDIYGIDLDMTLPQALKKWQAFEGSSRMDGDTSSFLASVDNTQTSIPTRPSGFADSFRSADGR